DASIGDDFPFKWDTVKGKKLLLQKLWNASRLAYPFIHGRKLEKPEVLHPIDQWILAKHKEFVEKAIQAYENQDFFVILSMLYEYFWETIADEYLELIKHRLFSDDRSATYTLGRILKDLIILLHPIAPHITEEIYSLIFGEKQSVLLETLPSTEDIKIAEEVVRMGDSVKKFNSLVRTNKVKMRMSMNSQIRVELQGPKQFLEDVMKVEDDLKKTLKITEIAYREADQLDVKISPT
ncbi:MAG: class I tRNA ligase family protein, partial [Metallosphaera sp.]